MALAHKTFVVVPCYNEAERLNPDAFVAAVEADPKLGFVFVDDGSTDATLSVLEQMGARQPERLVPLRLERNSGKAEAVRQGVLRAFELGAEVTGYWDADLATPLEYIPRFAEVLDQPDVQLVIGSRVRLLGRHVERSAARHYIGRGFATMAGIALALPIYDTQCGAKLFRANDVFRSVFSEPFELNWCFDVEIFARLSKFERRGALVLAENVVEYPLERWVDVPGSKLTPKHFVRVARELASLFVIARRARSG